MIQTIRISLDEEMLRGLLAGRIVHAPHSSPNFEVEIQIALKDIGWNRMMKALVDAMKEHHV